MAEWSVPSTEMDPVLSGEEVYYFLYWVCWRGVGRKLRTGGRT